MKLTIKKETIANLETTEMKHAKGGDLLTINASICPDLCELTRWDQDLKK